jgi:hypothetical protein
MDVFLSTQSFCSAFTQMPLGIQAPVTRELYVLANLQIEKSATFDSRITS